MLILGSIRRASDLIRLGYSLDPGVFNNSSCDFNVPTFLFLGLFHAQNLRWKLVIILESEMIQVFGILIDTRPWIPFLR